MRVAFGNMWATIQGYCRSTAQAVLEKHRAIFPETRQSFGEFLHDFAVFRPSVVAAFNNLMIPVEEKLRIYITLAYANDCLEQILPLGAGVGVGLRPSELNISPLVPLLKPLIECYAELKRDYAKFAPFAKNEIWSFLAQFVKDTGHFGRCNDDTRDSGKIACLKVAIWKRDRTYFRQFTEQVLLAIFDKSAKVGGSASEVSQARTGLRAFIDGGLNLYDKFTEGGPSSLAVLSAPENETSAKSHASNQPISTTTKLSAIDPATQTTAVEAARADLDGLIGLSGLKDEFRRLMNFLTIQKERQRHGLRESTQSLHFVFKGNPGTGKTTVARILGKIFFGFGILKTTKFVECDRSSLVGGFLGQTAIKTNETIESAMDGVLFIDEAYTLAGDATKYGHADMFGDEAINTLLKRMEDSRDRLIVIAAGYPALMNSFLKSNPGLESRFTRFIEFEDYSVQDLCRIFDKFCRDSEYTLSPTACANAYLLFAVAYQKRDERFGNARFVRNVYEQAINMQSDRLAKGTGALDKSSLVTIEGADIPFGLVADFDPLSVSLAAGVWEGVCPGCKKRRRCLATNLGKRVACDCGHRFIFPWFNLRTESVTGFPTSK